MTHQGGVVVLAAGEDERLITARWRLACINHEWVATRRDGAHAVDRGCPNGERLRLVAARRRYA